MADQLVELLMGLALFLDWLEGKVMVGIIPMSVQGREIGFVPIHYAVILILQDGTIVTTVTGLVLHLVEVLGGLILVLHHFVLLLDAFLDLQ